MSQEVAEFSVEDLSFKVQPLKLKQAQKGLALVSTVLLPALAGLASSSPAGLVAALQGVDRLPELFDLFASVTKVSWQDKYVPLADFADNVFPRRADLMLGYLAECVHVEYSSFLDERGKSVLTKAASRFASLTE